jgi:hypothetical protein
MRSVIFAILVAALALPSLAAAAGVGNPASLVGRENYGFTMEVEDQHKEIEGDPVESRRYLGKLIWGFTDNIDLYARLGVSDLRVHADGSPVFRGSEGMTYGGGMTVQFMEIESPHLTVLFNVQALSYYSEGDVVVPMSLGDDYWVEKYENRYRWSELQFSVFTQLERERWEPYIGLSMTNAFGEVRKNVYRVTEAGQHYHGSESNEFSEDAIPELILGMDVGIGGTGKLAGELRIGSKDLSFVVGVSELWR